MNDSHQRYDVPPGFSGWYCVRKCGPVEIEDTLGSPARCPRCHKPTVIYFPPRTGMDLTDHKPAHCASGRELAGEQRVLSAGATWERRMPTEERSKALFEHMRQVTEHPELNPDLSAIEKEEYER